MQKVIYPNIVMERNMQETKETWRDSLIKIKEDFLLIRTWKIQKKELLVALKLENKTKN